MTDDPPDLPGTTHRLEHVGGGVRLHVAEAGDPSAPPVLLVHGWPQHWWMWRHLIPVLASEHRVLAVDLRGFGWSDAPPSGYRKTELAADLLGLLDTLAIRRTAIVGHDWGGYIAYLLAGRHPDRLTRAAVLSAPPPRARLGLRQLPALRGFAHMPVLSTPLLGERAAGSPAFLGLVERLGSGDGGSPWSSRDRDLYVRRFADDPARAAAAAQVYRSFTVGGEVLRGPSVPRPGVAVLALHGERDPVGASLVPGAQVVAGAGHWLAEEAPGEVTQRIRAFLQDGRP